MDRVEEVMRHGLGVVFPAAQLEISQAVLKSATGDDSRAATWQTPFSGVYGWLDPDLRQRPTRADTLFDLASLTKLFVVATFITLVEEGAVALDQPVREVLPEFSGPRPIGPYEDPLVPGRLVTVEPALEDSPGSGSEKAVVDASQVTFRHLLAHNSGLPAWRPLFRAGSPEAGRAMALGTHFSYRMGSRVIYSDIGLILLGLAIQRLAHQRLDEVVRRRVTAPLGLKSTRYLPITQGGPHPARSPELDRSGSVAPTEECSWRGRRLVGEVHDENAAGLGGVAGHAGLFGTAAEVAVLGQMFLAGGPPLLRPQTVEEMTRLQAEDGAVRRGLGFTLWSADPDSSGNLLGPGAYGHTGFTGTSLWIDPNRALVVACLTNRVYYGREPGGIQAFRVALHRAIVEAIDR